MDRLITAFLMGNTCPLEVDGCEAAAHWCSSESGYDARIANSFEIAWAWAK